MPSLQAQGDFPHRAVGGVAEAENNPIARRNVPREPAVGGKKFRRQIENPPCAWNCFAFGVTTGRRRLDESIFRRGFDGRLRGGHFTRIDGEGERVAFSCGRSAGFSVEGIFDAQLLDVTEGRVATHFAVVGADGELTAFDEGGDSGRDVRGTAAVGRFINRMGDFQLRRRARGLGSAVVLGRRTFEGENCNVPVKTERDRWLRQLAIESDRTFDMRFAGSKLLHGVFRRVPRPAAAGPARAVLDANFKAEAVGLLQRELEGVHSAISGS